MPTARGKSARHYNSRESSTSRFGSKNTANSDWRFAFTLTPPNFATGLKRKKLDHGGSGRSIARLLDLDRSLVAGPTVKAHTDQRMTLRQAIRQLHYDLSQGVDTQGLSRRIQPAECVRRPKLRLAP